MRQALASVLHLFVVFAFFVAGFFFVCLPYLPETRIRVIDFFANQFEKCTLIGLGLFLTSLLLLIGFYALNRGRYLVLKMGVAVDVGLIRQTVEECFERQFAKRMSLSEIEMGPKSRLELSVKILSVEEKSSEELFAEAEKQIGLLLRERFGYSKPFILNVRL